MRWLRSIFRFRNEPQLFLTDTYPVQDTLAAIDDLSRAIKTNPASATIYSALGNLYRMRGDLDRAIQIRTSLISRPDLSTEDQARIYFELSRDYSRAGILDRAEEAMEKAAQLFGRNEDIDIELAELYAKCGEFLRAADLFRKLGRQMHAAHYYVRAACGPNNVIDQKLLDQALSIYPASPEAWLEVISMQARLGVWEQVLVSLKAGLKVVEPELGFLLLDPLFDLEAKEPEQILPDIWLDAFTEVIRSQPQSLPLIHYTGYLLRLHGREEEAMLWQEKALLLSPSFWPARLELLTMLLPDQQLTPGFSLQLNFLLDRAKQVKRFICRRCGLKRSRIFFCCPKCMSWHSIAFRELLND